MKEQDMEPLQAALLVPFISRNTKKHRDAGGSHPRRQHSASRLRMRRRHTD
jgi:hypothetical protein